MTFLHALNKPIVLRQSCCRVFDPFWDVKLPSDCRMPQQSHLTQGEAVGGQPVGKHSLGNKFF